MCPHATDPIGRSGRLSTATANAFKRATPSFSAYTQVRKQGEIVELVLGLGLLDWRSPDKGKAGSMHRKPPLVDRLQATTQALDQCSRPSL